MTTWLACLGDASNPATFGGFPAHVLQAGRAAGCIDQGLGMDFRAAPVRRGKFWWTLRQIVLGHGPGGYQYSDDFLTRLWSTTLAPDRTDSVINIFPLFPAALFDHLRRRIFYVDQTLDALFTGYGLTGRVPKAVRADAQARERMQFRAADMALFQSDWAARDAVARHGLRKDKVGVVIPGPNLDAAALLDWEHEVATSPPNEHRRDPEGPLRMVFVGRDWQRKGLDRLLRAMTLAQAQGARLKLEVIGPKRTDLPDALRGTQGVCWTGPIDKTRATLTFMRRVAAADLGCLLSRAEAGGISLREFVRLGVPTLAPDVGGAPEYVLPQASILIATDSPDEIIAEALVTLARDPDRRAAMQAHAWTNRHKGDWATGAQAMAEYLRRLA